MAKDQEKVTDKLEVVGEVKTAEKPAKKSAKKASKKKEKKKHGNPFKEMISELKKVTWPTRKELTGYCICVGIFIVVMALVVWLMDMGSGALIDFLTGIGKGAQG